ncbi:MAG TPA: hypothetical protein VHU80_22785, partial [Polyangiaceae bacterium]|nr:hypothetical protein [Polyangiaceae bacterium]
RHVLPAPAARVVAESVERVQRPRLALFRSAHAGVSVLVASNDPLLRASLFAAFRPAAAPPAAESPLADPERDGSVARSELRPDSRFDADVVALEIPSRSARAFSRAGWLLLPRWVALEVDLTLPERSLWDARKRETVRRIERSSFTLEVARGKDAAHDFHEHLYAPTARARHGDLAIVVRRGHVEAAARVGHVLFVREHGVRRVGLVVVPRPGSTAAIDALLFGALGGDYRATRLAREAAYLFALRWARDVERAARFGLTVAAPFADDGILRFKAHWGATALVDPRQGASIAVRVQRGSPEVCRALAAHPPIVLRQVGGEASLSTLVVRLAETEPASHRGVRGAATVELALHSEVELPRALERFAVDA